jgi:endogenous inhibitor of DNA gyrase (YacG/DUF329 family)
MGCQISWLDRSNHRVIKGVDDLGSRLPCDKRVISWVRANILNQFVLDEFESYGTYQYCLMEDDMEIIKRGTLPSERQYSGTCSTCGTQVKFKEGEARFHSDQRDGDFITVDCPVCGKIIYGTLLKEYHRGPGNYMDR